MDLWDVPLEELASALCILGESLLLVESCSFTVSAAQPETGGGDLQNGG